MSSGFRLSILPIRYLFLNRILRKSPWFEAGHRAGENGLARSDTSARGRRYTNNLAALGDRVTCTTAIDVALHIAGLFPIAVQGVESPHLEFPPTVNHVTIHAYTTYLCPTPYFAAVYLDTVYLVSLIFPNPM